MPCCQNLMRRRLLTLIMQQPTESYGESQKWGFAAPFPKDQVLQEMMTKIPSFSQESWVSG